MPDIFYISRVLGLAAISFIFALVWTPVLTHFLYKYRLGKQIRTKGVPVFAKFHKKKEGTPTMGGILIWGTVLFITLLFWLLAKTGQGTILENFNFLTRRETLLPLGALIASALVGLGDDLLGIFKIGPNGGGLKVRHRLLIYTIIATFGAWWFYHKLEWDLVHIPFVGDFNIGWWYILVFVFILVATAHSTNLTDGLDGLVGGILLIAFASYGVIAFSQGKFDLAAFCGVIIGALVAFLWFNIHPARFFMGDTGAMSLGITLGIIAMLTNAFLILPLIFFIPVIESLSVIIQITSRKIRNKKVFLSAPIHHHFEGKGWPESKITMRFWMVNGVMAVIGLIIIFIEKIL
ncbi:MAG: phospho-N-acetylmuramoyl-pentapeptide-transferase [Candidatus Portnoybacteria bacterium]|nr:phospho-N-acetylmuramoyl-pentapeptide-transferase [Candidatus Portnoybacteria bacterium]